jgi:hypothetical protein
MVSGRDGTSTTLWRADIGTCDVIEYFILRTGSRTVNDVCSRQPTNYRLSSVARYESCYELATACLSLRMSGCGR